MHKSPNLPIELGSSPRMEVLQSLRGLFALFIFLHHLGVFEAGGDAGVCFFMILSGFAMSNGYASRVMAPAFSYKAFFRRRLARIYPFHLAGFVAALILMMPWYGGMTPLVYLLNLLMLQSWVPIQQFYFSCDGPSWCLSDLLFCYALFPFILHFCYRARNKAVTLAMVSLLLGYGIAVWMIPPELYQPLIYISPVFRLIDFIIGVILWRIYYESRIIKHLSGTGIQLSAVFLYICFIMAYPFVPEAVGLASWWWIPTMLLLVSFCGRGMVSKFLSVRLLTKFGDYSFAFYVFHYPVIAMWRRLMHHLGHGDGFGLVSFVAIFLLTLLMSIVFQRSWEDIMASRKRTAKES